ncbi:MAG TPA: DUF1349 domain-containing protein [Hyphomicrobium sp.]|nr:DUF1349 domain-containing protein [Hyphomicrobium sp.]
MLDLTQGTWLNPPPHWVASAGELRISTGDKTDFWRTTYYGFERDSGHFYHWTVRGDFTASLTFDGRYEQLYDQAGLMLRIDEQNWIKLGVEFSDGAQNFSFVCTRGVSDWSVVRFARLDGPQTIRITRIGTAAIADYRTEAGTWQMLRVCPFPDAADILVGPMACSPQRAGFDADFRAFDIGTPLANPLHG